MHIISIKILHLLLVHSNLYYKKGHNFVLILPAVVCVFIHLKTCLLVNRNRGCFCMNFFTAARGLNILKKGEKMNYMNE